MSVVIDANLLVVLVTDEERGPPVSAKLGEWASGGEALHAPALARYETANALTRLVAGGRIDPEQATRAWGAASEVPVTYHGDVAGPDIIAIALRLERRSAYDAAYLALAIELDAVLWTLDGRLARNAHSHGFKVELLPA